MPYYVHTTKRLRLDDSYQQIPASEPALTKEQADAIAARHKEEKRKREGRCAPSARAPCM